MTEWKDRKRGLDAATNTAGTPGSGGPVSIPLGPGEWDEGLGIPLCVVCQGVGYCWIYRKSSTWLTGSPILGRQNRKTRKRARMEGRGIRFHPPVHEDDFAQTYGSSNCLSRPWVPMATELFIN